MTYKHLPVFLTGHTGFKGGWLAAWLKREGATVTGFSLEPEPGRPSLFAAASIAEGMTSIIGDIRDGKLLAEAVSRARPTIIFHLAAQPLVRRSYADPVTTFETNVLGTVNVLEAARRCDSVRAVICVTTDKVYRNREWPWGYRETDELGGKDPYSASKACAELVAACYSQTLLKQGHRPRLATARGGNVVGGGDWSDDRLVPDLVRAIAGDQPIILRNPDAVRPWQHVLELVRAYLMLGQQLLDGVPDIDTAWNFGPDTRNEIDVEGVVRRFVDAWGKEVPVIVERSALPETRLLRLDTAQARALLGWKPRLDIDQTLTMTSRWYRDFYAGADPRRLVEDALAGYARSI